MREQPADAQVGRREDTDTPTSVESGQVNMTWSEANRRVARSSVSNAWRRAGRPSVNRFTFGHCKPASAGRSEDPCTSSADDRTETVAGPSGTRAASRVGKSRRRIGARGRCLSSTDVGNPGKADSRFYSDRPTRRRSMGTGRARRSRAGAPAGFSGRSWPMFTRDGWRSLKAHHPGPSLHAGVHVIGTYLAPEIFSVTTSSG
jgi:hypothetical protein